MGKIQSVIESGACKIHLAEVGEACWYIYPSKNPYSAEIHKAVCGVRIRAAGFVGKISPQSIRVGPPKKTPRKSQKN